MKNRTEEIVLLLGLFGAVFGAKVLAISHYGSVVPFWDQWDAEPELIYLPFLNGELSLKLLFAQHNEHRIFFTRILSLAGLLAAGEWNPILQMIANAALHSVAIVLLTWAFTRDLQEQDRAPLVILCALTFSLPIAGANLLAGFQSQFYFALLFSTASFVLILKSEALPSWIAGVLAAAASYVSLASGIFTFFVAAAVLVFRATAERSITGRKLLLITFLVIGGIVCLAFLERPPGYEIPQVHSFSQFMTSLIWLSGFPFSAVISIDRPLAIRALILLFAVTPIFILLAKTAMQRNGNNKAWFTLAVAAFVAVQIVSISYNRAEGFNSPRYFDILLPMVPAGFAALSLARVSGSLRGIWLFGAVVSLVYFAVSDVFPGLALQKQISDRQLQNVKAFVETGATFEGKPYIDIPYPNPKRLELLLSMPSIRAMLPGEIRPDDQTTQALRARFFPYPRLYFWTARLTNSLLKPSSLIFPAGIALLFVSYLRRPRLIVRNP